MNILYFCQLYPPAIYGGGEYIFFQWARELVKRGHRVFTITQRLVGTKDHEIIEGVDVHRVGPSIRYQGSLSVSIAENLGYVMEAVVRGTFLLLRHRVDVVHSNTYAPTLVGQICSTIFRKPHLITFHDVFLRRGDFWQKWTEQNSIGHLTAPLGPIFERFALRLPATTIHTVSETSKKDLISCNVRSPVVVVPNAISLGEYGSPNSALSSDRCQAIYVGRLVFYKNVETVIRAFRKVLKKIPKARLVIVGDGPLRKHLQEVTKDLGSNVLFTGRVSQEKKVRLLRQSSFLVLPSLVEGFGIVILEAFGCQKPVLVSNIMPLPEIVEDGTDGFIIPAFESDIWANKMSYLFTNPRQAEKMGLKGYDKLLKNYVIEHIVNQLETLYRAAILHRSYKWMCNF